MGSNLACDGIFPGRVIPVTKNWHSSGYPAGARRYRVNAGTGLPGVSILRPGEVESWICNFCLGVAARKLV